MENFYSIIFWILLSIFLIIIGTAKFKFHPALVLFTVAMITALGFGNSISESIKIVSLGFGNMLANIGILILLGCILAVILEELNSIQYLSTLFLKAFGLKRPFLLLSSLGGLIGIPVFCDVAYIILSNFSKSLAQKAGVSKISTSITIASSLYIAHNLIPPTPGPLAVIGNFQASNQLGLVFLLGVIISIFLVLILAAYARYISAKTAQSDITDNHEEVETSNQSFLIITPLLIPIILIAIGSFIGLSENEYFIFKYIEIMGNPIIALGIGVLIGLFLLRKRKSNAEGDIIKDAISQAGPILIITGLGGSYGQVIKNSAFSDLLIENVGIESQQSIIILLMAYLLAFFIKTAQGSSTSAMIIVSSIIAPLIIGSELNNPLGISLLVLAIGSGAMMVSHSNDSYFWVVKEFSGMSVKQSLKNFSVGTILLSISSFLMVLLMFWILI
ncbi:GntP family permease [Marivirga arenosa]|uniref:GntP family permease n=1 Tax=Marivirga arenosa TaxID=3059076 RepID=A0AA51N8D2_9BACT|nr:GntP family permease [Marivirga sp. ABR2-2]WMN08027.1 GntP family permease [Marivirga sp. ABR2-2]